MNHNVVPEIVIITWEESNGNVVIKRLEKKIILNYSASIVWKCIDGTKSIDDIISMIYEEYKEDDTMENISSIVEETIGMLQKEKLIAVRDAVDFDGWFEYE